MTEKVAGELPARSEVAEADTWNLGSIYATNEAWEADFETVKSEIARVESYKGRLGTSAKVLLEALTLSDSIDMKLGKLLVYANMRLHQDMSNHAYQAMAARIGDLNVASNESSSFYRPELLALNPETLDAFVAEEPGLAVYNQQFADMNRTRSRARSPEVEAVLAKIATVTAIPDNVRDQLGEADLKLPQILGPDGKPIQLTQENFGDTFLDNKDRGTRERGWRGMMEAYKAFSNTFAALYSGQVKVDQFYASVRGYGSSVEAALDRINMPVSFYRALLDTVHANLPRLARYLELRERLLGVDELQLWDLYVPIIEASSKKFDRQEGIEMVLKALAPLGDEYVGLMREGFTTGRWVDWVANQNKRSGAYSWGSYGTQPFILMNTSDGKLSLDQVYTLAHEGGHSMHSLLTRRTQPFQSAGYTTFLAEMASTCNESLLTRHLLSTIEDKATRQTILNQALEGFRGTLYRQALFAEFELMAHTAAENGEAITKELLARIHRKLYRRYYGSVVVIDPAIGDEWMRIPHFFSPFYVWTYATGISAGSAFAKALVEEGEPARKRYLEFLSSGKSDYSTNLLLKAGIDFSTPAPVQAALDEFDELLTLFEKTFE